MLTFIVRRLLAAVLVMFVITVIVFVIFFKTPGVDPARAIAGRNPSAQVIQEIREQFGLDKPLPVQYGQMMKSIFISRDLVSYSNQGVKVVPEIAAATPATLSLVFGAAIIWIVMSILLRRLAVVFKRTMIDPLIMILALIGISMPVFWLGIIARYYLAEGGVTSFFPDGEYYPLTTDPLKWFSHLILPWFVLAVLFIGFYGRVLRGNILDTINEDYVRTARAKGLPPRRILLKHVLRTSLIPIVTLFGLDFASVLGGGAILTETVFDLHGVGQYAAQSINNFDLPPIMGVTMYGAFFIVAFSMMVDLFYAYLDPRIRPT